MTFIRDGIGTSDQYRSFTHFFSVCLTPFVVYFVVVIYICSSVLFRSAHEISIFLCSFRTDCFSAVTFDLFPLSMGLLFLPLTQSFSFYDISTFFFYHHSAVVELVAQSQKKIFHQLMLAVISGKFLHRTQKFTYFLALSVRFSSTVPRRGARHDEPRRKSAALVLDVVVGATLEEKCPPSRNLARTGRELKIELH